MTGNEAVLHLLEAMELHGIDYMVTGSYASNVHGIPRSTKDADLIVEAPSRELEKLLDALAPPLRPDPQMLFETVTSSKRWIVRVDGSEFVVEIFLLNSHPFDRSRFDRRIRVEVFPGIEAALPTAEDVIVQKLRWSARAGRPKDLQDASDVIAVQGAGLDWPYIERWCDQLDASEVLREARAMADEV